MLTIGVTPILLTIISKLDLNPLIAALKNLEIFDGATNKDEALAQLSGEKLATVAAEMFAAVAPQLGKIANDIPEFVALYKSISREDANKLDLAEVMNELLSDDGIRSFFTRALRKKAEQTA